MQAIYTDYNMNNLDKVYKLTFYVIVGLLVLSCVPQFKIMGEKVKRIDPLSELKTKQEQTVSVVDIYTKEELEMSKDSAKIRKGPTPPQAPKPVEYMDSVPANMVAIEDYAQTEQREMDKLYAALDQADQRNVRIMFFGDSFIEGDILTQELRERLQSRYGGSGVGFVDITSITSAYRESIRAKDSGWDSHHANDRRGFVDSLQGFNAKYFIPKGKAMVQYTCPKNVHPEHLSSYSNATIYFTPADDMMITATVGSNPTEIIYSYNPADEGKILSRSVYGNISDIRYEVQGGPGSRCYGVSLEGDTGISVDNMSLRGSNGRFLSKIPQSTLDRFGQLRPYDLIIILYGLNVAASNVRNYSSYIDKMRPAIRNFHQAYPGASILLVGVSDRDEMGENGVMRTMTGIQELVNYQRQLAEEEHVAFWDLRMAMGGDLAITKMRKEGMAQADYVHINFKGGKFLAGKLYDVLMNGKENYDRRQKMK